MKVKKSCVVAVVLLICAMMTFPASALAAEVVVAVADLNAGKALPSYRAGDTLLIVGSAPLNTTGWETLKYASAAFSLILENGQTSIPDSAMTMNTALIAVEGTHVTWVGKNAFFSCISLESVYFPSMTTIGENAFYVCAKLTEISLFNVSSIGRDAFRGCEKLESFSMPLVDSVPEGAFANCRALTSFELPRAKTIARNAFDGNSALTEIYLPAAEFVGLRAFYRASSVWELFLPEVAKIESEAFSGCTSLKFFRLDDADPSVDEDAFAGVGRITIYSNRKTLTSKNYPPYDLANPGDSDSSSGCNALHSAAILLCAALFLKRAGRV